jgi:sugar transferase (PEP-CTERM/EpsH1 system associated)
LLLIAHRVPYPPDKGERVRAYHEIRALSADFRVTVAALAHSREDRRSAAGLKPFCEAVLTARAGGTAGLARGAWSLLFGGSVTEGYFRSRLLRHAVVEAAGNDPFDVVLGYSSSTLPYVLAAPGRARVMDLVDADSAKWGAYAQAARWPKSWLYAREARGVRRLERQALRGCDAVLLVSEAEAETLGDRGGNVWAVGNGVDTDYFRPAERDRAAPPSLVFTGSMDYRPNVEAVTWFAREVWPPLKRDVPDLEFTIVGRDPVPAVRRLQGEPDIRVTGTVSDVRPHLAAATAVVAPLRTARGIQNKVLEAMAMGRAVVVSPAALAGLDADVGREVLMAETPEQWRGRLLELLRDDVRRGEVERAARRRVETSYDWEGRMRSLVDLCLRLSGVSSEDAAQEGDASGQSGRLAPRGRTDGFEGTGP